MSYYACFINGPLPHNSRTLGVYVKEIASPLIYYILVA